MSSAETTSGSSQTSSGLQISDHFNLALLAIAIYSIELVFIAFFFPGRARSQVFSKSFMMENFEQEHVDTTYESIQKSNGYPDMGEGRYADQLPYHQWLHFGKAQRVHYNFLENWGPQVLFILVGAISFPLASAILGFVAIFARILYSFGYMQAGGNNSPMRVAGAFLGDICLLGTFALASYTCISPYLKSSGSSTESKPAAQPSSEPSGGDGGDGGDSGE